METGTDTVYCKKNIWNLHCFYADLDPALALHKGGIMNADLDQNTVTSRGRQM